MTALDWVFAVVLVASVLIGAWRGLVYEVLSLASWVVAFFAARIWGAHVGAWLPMQDVDEGLRTGAGFVITFVAALFALGISIWLVGKLVMPMTTLPLSSTSGRSVDVRTSTAGKLSMALSSLSVPESDSTQ